MKTSSGKRMAGTSAIHHFVGVTNVTERFCLKMRVQGSVFGADNNKDKGAGPG